MLAAVVAASGLHRMFPVVSPAKLIVKVVVSVGTPAMVSRCTSLTPSIPATALVIFREPASST